MSVNNIGRVRKSIKDAFFIYEINCSERLNHEECVEMRVDIISLTDDDIVATISELLIDVLDTYESGRKDFKFIDMLIYFLNPLSKDERNLNSEVKLKEVMEELEAELKKHVHGVDNDKYNIMKTISDIMSMTNDQMIKNYLGEEAFEKYNAVEKTDYSLKFTHDQSSAIHEWLELIGGWPELNGFNDIINYAKEFWYKRTLQ